MVTVRTFGITNPRLSKYDGSQLTAVSVERLSITFDRTWAPFVQAQLQLLAPAVAMASADPRTGFRSRFTLTQDDLAGGTSSADFDLTYRGRDIDWSTGTATATATSDEALWREWISGSNGIGGYPDNTGGVQEAASKQGYSSNARYFQLAGAPTVVMNASGSVPTPQDAEDYWAPGVTAWDYASQLVELAGAWLYCDELGTFRYAAQGYSPTSTQRTFTDSTNLLGVVDSVNRDDPAWANFAVVGFTKPGASSTAYVSSSAGVEPRKGIALQRARAKPASGNAANGVRANAQRAGRKLNLTAVADIGTRPNQPVSVSWLGQSAVGVIESVSFSFPEGTMQVAVAVTE